jgi:hypothetical protein
MIKRLRLISLFYEQIRCHSRGLYIFDQEDPKGLLQKQSQGEMDDEGVGWRCKVKTYLRSVVYQV